MTQAARILGLLFLSIFMKMMKVFGHFLSAQYSLAEPTAYLPQAESSLPDNFETVRYSTINNSMNPDSALPSLCIPPNFGEFEMAHIVNSILVTQIKKPSVQTSAGRFSIQWT